jgi:hypothetical protein
MHQTSMAYLEWREKENREALRAALVSLILDEIFVGSKDVPTVELPEVAVA